MKTLYLLFMMIACAALMRGACYADPPAPLSEQSHSRNSDATAGNHPDNARQAALVDSDQNSQGTQAGEAKANTQQASHRQERPAETANNNLPKGPFANSMNFHQSVRPAGAASGEMLKMEDKSRLPARPTALVPLGGTSFNNVHNQSSAPVVIGGTADSVRSTAAINGTGMNRKP
jgi:hypothetical protein